MHGGPLTTVGRDYTQGTEESQGSGHYFDKETLCFRKPSAIR